MEVTKNIQPVLYCWGYQTYQTVCQKVFKLPQQNNLLIMIKRVCELGVSIIHINNFYLYNISDKTTNYLFVYGSFSVHGDLNCNNNTIKFTFKDI